MKENGEKKEELGPKIMEASFLLHPNYSSENSCEVCKKIYTYRCNKFIATFKRKSFGLLMYDSKDCSSY